MREILIKGTKKGKAEEVNGLLRRFIGRDNYSYEGAATKGGKIYKVLSNEENLPRLTRELEKRGIALTDLYPEKVTVIAEESSVNPTEKLLETVFPDFAEAVAEERVSAEIEALYPANLVETLFPYLPEVEDDNPKALRPYKPRVLTPEEAEAKAAVEKAREALRAAKETAKAEREKERLAKAANRSSNGVSGTRRGLNPYRGDR